MLSKKTIVSVFLISISAAVFAMSASSVRDEALAKDSVQGSVDYILTHISSVDSESGKKSLWNLAGNFQELCLDWSGAAKSYVQASRISAAAEKDFPNVSIDELRLSAARCFLNYGNYGDAEINLNSLTGKNKNEKQDALANLYSVWVVLCQINLPTDIRDSLDRLKSYLEMDSMKSVRASVLFTLWYVGGEKKYAETLKKDYPSSPECAIVLGKAKLSSVPFWYFVPRFVDEESLHYKSQPAKTEATQKSQAATKPSSTGAEKKSETKTSSATTKPKVEEPKKEQPKKDQPKVETKKVAEQLGLFRKKENADALIKRAKEKGFNAYSYSETRTSGTTYYIVVVDENAEGTMGKKLRAAGFDCYPVE